MYYFLVKKKLEGKFIFLGCYVMTLLLLLEKNGFSFKFPKMDEM